MSTDEKRVNKALSNLGDFLDFAEWSGRIPSAKSEDKYERRLAFWLIHMKQARQGKSSCLWHEEMESCATSRGYPGIFTEDPRTLRFFNLTGQKIGGYEVINKISTLSRWNQVQWKCSNGNKEEVIISGYNLVRIRDRNDYSSLESASSHLVGRRFGCWELRGLYDIGQDESSVWYCSRDDDGISTIKKIKFLSLQSLTRYINVIDGNPVDKVISPLLGSGVEDMTGQKIGRWTVIGFSHKAVNNECVWDCVCDCGTLSKVSGGKLRNGCSLSCGCLRKTILAKSSK